MVELNVSGLNEMVHEWTETYSLTIYEFYFSCQTQQDASLKEHSLTFYFRVQAQPNYMIICLINVCFTASYAKTALFLSVLL
jgi:hypothetical protein